MKPDDTPPHPHFLKTTYPFILKLRHRFFFLQRREKVASSLHWTIDFRKLTSIARSISIGGYIIIKSSWVCI
uniref:Uncharacterized protein n=1 Tax=Salix viminalis TaxID=40686 RepID=A0A6N2LPY2_SALVM